jgi:Dolichyl-phosphate-mannose-protein mannosyltransferase
MRESLSRFPVSSSQNAISAALDRVPFDTPAWPRSQPIWRWLLLLLVLTAAMRIWQLCHTEVTSRDSLTYIRMAWQLEQADWRVVLRDPHTQQHPGYPVTVMLASWVVRPFVHNDLVIGMRLGAQLASSAASVLLVIPMFFLGLQLFNRRISFWATLLFQCLPASGRVLGDGLSEALFLLWAASCLLFAARALRTGSLFSFALCGLCSGLAFLTRPEGIALVTATGLVLLGRQFLAHCRSDGRQFLLRGATLAVATLVVILPYMLVMGRLAAKLGTQHTLGLVGAEQALPNPPAELLPSGLTATPLAVWWPTHGDDDPLARYAWSARMLFQMLGRALFWGLWIPTLIGLWYARDYSWRIPGAWVMLALFAMVMTVLFRITVIMGYLSERHMLLLVLCLSYWTVVGLDWMGHGLAAVLAWLRPAGRSLTSNPACSLVLLTALTVIPAYKSLETLHSNRFGFRDAGQWLAHHTAPEDPILDPFGWAYYYAGRIFTEPLPPSPSCDASPRYVILEETDNDHKHLQGWPEAKKAVKQGHGQVVQDWPVSRGRIAVYEVSLPPHWQPR